MDLPKKIEGKIPYYDIADIIKQWCEKNVYTDFIVTINLDGRETTEYLSFDASELDFVFENDWWEGEKNIQLCGFIPVGNISIHGCPSNANVGFDISCC